MRNLGFLCLLVFPVLFSSGCASEAPSDAEAKELLSRAAGISPATWGAVRKAGGAMKREEVPEQSLTTYLMATYESTPDFQLLAINPARLAVALMGGKQTLDTLDERTDYVSYIRPEYVTKLDMTRAGSQASGIAEFEVPKLYKGKVSFTLTKTSSGWRVSTISMPGNGLALRANDNGRWEVDTPVD